MKAQTMCIIRPCCVGVRRRLYYFGHRWRGGPQCCREMEFPRSDVRVREVPQIFSCWPYRVMMTFYIPHSDCCTLIPLPMRALCRTIRENHVSFRPKSWKIFLRVRWGGRCPANIVLRSFPVPDVNWPLAPCSSAGASHFPISGFS